MASEKGVDLERGESAAPTKQRPGWEEPSLSLSVHDSTRLEWSVLVPLPSGRPLRYRLEVELSFPSHVFTPHSPWQQLQSYARFQAPESERARTPGTLDVIRREALSATRHLSRASEGFRRHCADVRLGQGMGPGLDLTTSLGIWLRVALEAVKRSRDRIRAAAPIDSKVELQERALADEYVGVEVLWTVTAMARALEETKREQSSPDVQAACEAVFQELGSALAAELAWRRSRGLVEPQNDPRAMESYLARASLLKKHFESVLYLVRESRAAEKRAEPWITAMAAAGAGAVAFLLQLALLRVPLSSGAGVGSGIAALALVGGALYAARERVKEMGRAWLKSGVERFTAQRATRFVVPGKPPVGRVVAKARESFETTTTFETDPLNPLLGATVPRTALRFVHAGRTFPVSAATERKGGALRLVFRYDLTTLLPRLHDPVKPVATIDSGTGLLSLVGAPRTYQIPLRLALSADQAREEQLATLVVTKFGLHRLDIPPAAVQPLARGAH